ncbi:MAG TPA: PDZ domain-containing protein, partial [Pirellulales bacterium]
MKPRFGIWQQGWLIGLCALVGPVGFCTAVIGPAVISLQAVCRAADGPLDKAAAEKNAAKATLPDKSEKSADKEAKWAADKQRDQKADEEDFELFKSLADTIDQVERNYVKPIDRRELMEAAIKGILTKLDPYSSYINPDEIGSFRTEVEHQFGGIGIQITLDENGQLKISSPLVGTPAYKAGVLAGDRIVKIEGTPTKELSLEQAVKKLKGEVGTSVTFTVDHSHGGGTET